MQYLANFYRNKCEQLNEQYNKLFQQYKFLSEDAGQKFASMTDDQFKNWSEANPGGAQKAAELRKAAQKQASQSAAEETGNAAETASQVDKNTDVDMVGGVANSTGQEVAGQAHAAKAKAAAQKPGAEPKNAPKGAAQNTGKAAANTEANAARGAAQNTGKAAGAAEKTAQEVASGSSKAAGVASKAGGLARGVATGVGGMAGVLGGDYLIGKAEEAVGMDPDSTTGEVIRNVGSGALGGVAEAGVASALGAGTGLGAAGLATAAGTGALVAGAGYLGYKAGEKIANIEVNDKGDTVGTKLGDAMWYGSPQIRAGMNILAGNSPFAVDPADQESKSAKLTIDQRKQMQQSAEQAASKEEGEENAKRASGAYMAPTEKLNASLTDQQKTPEYQERLKKKIAEMQNKKNAGNQQQQQQQPQQQQPQQQPTG